MKFSTRFLRFLSKKDDDKRMEIRRKLSEAEARAIDLNMMVNAHRDTLIEQLRRSFQTDKHD